MKIHTLMARLKHFKFGETFDRSAILSRLPAIVAVALFASFLGSCGLITRTETDYYTVTDRDTTITEDVRNIPGSVDDNGVVYPSSRTKVINRHTLSHDSTYDRRYPAFLRAGGIETAGLIGSSSLNGLGTGLFGLYDIFNADQFSDSSYGTVWRPTDSLHPQNNTSHLFKGFMLRIAPYEMRLRWFNDAPNWTLGWSAVELLAPDENRANWLKSYGTNLYVRRRFFLYDRVPFIIFSPFLGGSLYPSLYANLGAELHVGSLAGLNLRAYAGLASGFTWPNSSGLHTFPYLGLGVSVLDFTNRVEETEKEWKEYMKTGINFNILEASMLRVGTNYLSYFDSTTNLPITGLMIKVGSMEVPLPFANYHFWAGTSLLNWTALGFAQQGIGVLPLRVGYRQYLLSEDLMLEPFFEYNYYPSNFYNIGVKLKLDTYTGYNIGITAGYVAGNPGNFTPKAFNTLGLRDALSFGTTYVGLTFYLGDWNYSPELVRTMRATEHY